MGINRFAGPRGATGLHAVLAGALLAVAASACPAAEDLYQEARQLCAKYTADIEQLAQQCEQKGLAAEAKRTRAVLGRQDPYKLYLPILPREVGPAKPPAGAAPEVVQWHGKFLKLRQDQAAAIFDLAQRAVRQRQSALAYQGVVAAIREDPDNEGARRVLGYQNYQGQWHTAYEIRKLRAGMVWHEKFGWLPEGYVARYEKGERFSGGRWVSAEADAAAHRDIRSGWSIETEHYLIRTNHGLEAAVVLGTKLETLCRLWQQIFIRYYASAADVDALFSGRSPARRAEPPRFDVVFFHDQDQYNRALRPIEPNIAISHGIYISRERTAYFFAGSEDADRVMYHEATHQLFHQSRRVPPDVGSRANFWIVEGIAMYMESLHQEDGYYVLGGLDDERMTAARYHLLKENYYVPFAQLVATGMAKLQSDPKLAKLYSQMAAMTNFLVYYKGGRYRDALVAYLTAVYSGHDDARTLATLTGTSYTDLDKEYQEFMRIEVK